MLVTLGYTQQWGTGPVFILNIENRLIQSSRSVIPHQHLMLHKCVSCLMCLDGLNSRLKHFLHVPSISPTQPHCIAVIALQRNVCVRACSTRVPRLSWSRKKKKNTHYKHFVSVFPHAIGSSDSGQSKVPEMPEEASLTCMRARAGLWCNWCNGEGQGPAQPAPDIKAQMWTQHLGFLVADSVRFEDGGWIFHGQHFVNRWIPLIVLPPKCFMLSGI